MIQYILISAIPLINTPNGPLNPQVIRLIKGVQSETLSVETVTPLSSIKIYPNPSPGVFTINGVENEVIEIVNTMVKSLILPKSKIKVRL